MQDNSQCNIQSGSGFIVRPNANKGENSINIVNNQASGLALPQLDIIRFVCHQRKSLLHFTPQIHRRNLLL